MVVTDITPLDRKKSRVCLDNEYAFPLYLSELRKFHIEVGSEIQEHHLQELNGILTGRVRERILYLLEAADKSEHDIRRKLLRAGYPEKIISDVLVQLKEYHYIDDVRYARSYIASMREGRGKSTRIIKEGLYQKGISREIIEELLPRDETDERELVLRALRKKGYTVSEVKKLDYRQKQKLYAAFMRLGFRSQDITSVFDMDEPMD